MVCATPARSPQFTHLHHGHRTLPVNRTGPGCRSSPSSTGITSTAEKAPASIVSMLTPIVQLWPGSSQVELHASWSIANSRALSPWIHNAFRYVAVSPSLRTVITREPPSVPRSASLKTINEGAICRPFASGIVHFEVSPASKPSANSGARPPMRLTENSRPELVGISSCAEL